MAIRPSISVNLCESSEKTSSWLAASADSPASFSPVSGPDPDHLPAPFLLHFAEGWHSPNSQSPYAISLQDAV